MTFEATTTYNYQPHKQKNTEGSQIRSELFGQVLRSLYTSDRAVVDNQKSHVATDSIEHEYSVHDSRKKIMLQ